MNRKLANYELTEMKPYTNRDPIRLVLADVDGTLVTQEKVLTAKAKEAVAKLGEAGIAFAVIH